MADGIAVSRLGLCGNPRKDELQQAISVLRRICSQRGVQVSLHDDLARILGEPQVGQSDEELVENSDLLVALGGDGTMLRAARMIGDSGTPLLGINLGSLGYLTDVPLDHLPAAIGRVLDGDFLLAGRSRVHCLAMRSGKELTTVTGLNDIVVNMGPLPRTLDLELRVGGTTLGRWLGDGVIFATASGSTAYSLSAGGAICQPELRGLLVTPICPHSLGVRPLILGDHVVAELLLHEVGEGATLTADGQVATPLRRDDRLVCRLSDPTLNLVKFHDSNFYDVLHQKLHWGVAPRLRLESRRYHADSRDEDT